MNDPAYFRHPERIDINRIADEGVHYLIYHPTETGKFNAKQLTIYAVAGMIKHLATLKKLREGLDEVGRIKTAKVPTQNRGAEDEYRRRFLNIKWDDLGSTPTTWSLRFDGLGAETAAGVDNSQQGHDIDLLAKPSEGSAIHQFMY